VILYFARLGQTTAFVNIECLQLLGSSDVSSDIRQCLCSGKLGLAAEKSACRAGLRNIPNLLVDRQTNVLAVG